MKASAKAPKTSEKVAAERPVVLEAPPRLTSDVPPGRVRVRVKGHLFRNGKAYEPGELVEVDRTVFEAHGHNTFDLAEE